MAARRVTYDSKNDCRTRSAVTFSGMEKNYPLLFVYLVKIFGTLALWSAPLLLAPASVFAALGLPDEPMLTYRLLGWAYAVLCIGYGLGLHAEWHGRRETIPLWVGLYSNGGAAVVLGHALMTGALGNHFWLNLHISVSAISALSIALGLYAFGLKKPIV